jgi:hypothetical protein
MTRPTLTDALIREALAPEPGTTAPVGLLASISSEVARTPQRRPLLRLHGFAAERPASRRLTWMAIAAAAMLGLVAGLLLGGGGPPRLQSLEVQPSPLPADLPFTAPGQGVHILGVSGDEAWASLVVTRDGRDGLWHRTAAGWSRSLPTDETGSVRGLAGLPDGRIVVGADNGIWVGKDDGWKQVTPTPSTGVAVDTRGTIWAGESGGALRSYREAGGTWQVADSACPVGVMWVTVAVDGSVWVAGDGYSSISGIARLQGGNCTEVFPLDDAVSYSVGALVADGEGRVATVVFDPTQGDVCAGAQIMALQEGSWTSLRRGQDVCTSWNGIAYAPDGTLWASINGGLWRFAHGVWSQQRRATLASPVSVGPAGTVWFLADGAIEHLHPDAGTDPPGG